MRFTVDSVVAHTVMGYDAVLPQSTDLPSLSPTGSNWDFAECKAER